MPGLGPVLPAFYIARGASCCPGILKGQRLSPRSQGALEASWHIWCHSLPPLASRLARWAASCFFSRLCSCTLTSTRRSAFSSPACMHTVRSPVVLHKLRWRH